MWIFQNFAEPTFMLIGLLMGFFYGFDGWQGSPEKLSFSQSPRAKNLIWVVVGAFSTFLTHLVFENVSKSRLLFFYFCAFVIGSGVVVCGIGLGILSKYGYIKLFKPEKYPAPPFSPILDYIFYGYRYVKEDYTRGLVLLDQRAQERQHEFLPKYGRQVSQAVAAVSSYVADPTELKRMEITKAILNSIVAVIHLYHSSSGLWFNANCMIAYHRDQVPAAVLQKLKFAWGDQERYEYFLHLYAYADSKGAMDFSLPVEGRNTPGVDQNILPGAPEAFSMNETVVVDNITNISYPPGVPADVRNQIDSYFKRRKTFQSFACLNIVYGGRQVGLVNVESNRRNIFGKNQEHKDELESLLFPFCFLLGFLVRVE